MRAFLAVAILAIAASAMPGDNLGLAAAGCHNVTGTCLKHGFVCASGEVVPHAKRCDQVEDCADGTDEFMCDATEGHRPYHTRTEEERHAHAQASCIHCNCEVNVLQIGPNNPWESFAKVAPLDLQMMTGSAPYGGMPCEPVCTWVWNIVFFKKTGVCRGWLCCARQRSCQSCYPANTAGRMCLGPASQVRDPSLSKRCYTW
jgi:hypothetical protein